MLPSCRFILFFFVCSLYQHAADGQFVDADDFTKLAAEVAGIKTEFHSRIAELETNLSEETSRGNAVREELNIALVKVAEMEDKMRGVEAKLKIAEARIAELEGMVRIESNADDIIGSHSTGGDADVDPEHQMQINEAVNTSQAQRKDVKARQSVRGSIHRLSKRIVLTTTQQFAFSVSLESPLAGLGTGHPIKFDRVHLNDGNAFDSIVGVFICPVSGTYFFQSALLSEQYDIVITDMVIDGSVLVRMYASGSTTSHGFDQGFNSVITSCNQGQHVWVRQDSGTALHGGSYASFSGFLLWESD